MLQEKFELTDKDIANGEIKIHDDTGRITLTHSDDDKDVI